MQPLPGLIRQSSATNLLCVLIGLTVAGCGFQLRGASTVPDAVQPLALKCKAPVPDRLCRAVENQLNLGQVATSTPGKAAATLELTGFRQERRANAVTSRAVAAEYTLRQSVNAEVVSASQRPLLVRERVSTTESYRYDETNVLAKQREEEALQERLSERLAQQILFRLAPLNQTRVDSLEEAQ
ncbi:LPS assembly lipoprotein LptE [Marinobacter sp. CHS3-4]|uniref:LPS-assembly lipoprotein LptE n=1 Tax=Marinobacter sp. CHS3-4 TaxID=3045174 RepID=UPI0024B51476|nr:LPS assembly lipoprotein LptE [Marinobacter sp. CHS3-4]MDI9244898.1 LPS assembly lipoprotein LptE [Marinobacter sp. CHS3-4]